ncbi:MAG: hypothetical protein HZB39_19035 [Planctomycetes bacterium]|nr:hypothetical protein [Planctomycetota bacterium]
MTLRLRVVAALAFVALAGVTGAWLFQGDGTAGGGASQPGDARFRWTNSEQCRDCHRAVWDEWQGSHHQISYLNPEVRKLSDDFRNKECQACHLPQPIDVTGFGQRALPRLTRPDQGVDCITCHVGRSGEVFAAHDVPTAPCRPRTDPRFVSMSLCESCHNQHQTTDQWRASPSAKQDVDCNDCHMPDVERSLAGGVVRKGRGHGYPGAHDAAMLGKASEFDARIEGGELVAVLANTGAGHNFPTEERHRAVDVVWRAIDAQGQAGEWSRAFRFRQPYREEPGENTQLPAGERKELRVALPPGTVKVGVRLWYRLNPYAVDGDAASTLLAEREVIVP